jgi:hypothetical protein
MPRPLVKASSIAALVAFVASAFVATEALADRVVILPAHGDAATALEMDLYRATIALGHTPVAATDVAAAVKQSVFDGVADAPEELKAVAAATKADWIVSGTIASNVSGAHVELSAYLTTMGRTESVARDVDKAATPAQEQEMLAVLLRPEGIGAGALPWEQQGVAKVVPPPVPPPAVVAVPPPPPVPTEPDDGLVNMDYMSTSAKVFPPYSAGRKLALSALQGFSFVAKRPGEGATGSGFAMNANVRGAYMIGQSALEVLVDLGGNLSGPRALFANLGARWMYTPSLHRVRPSGQRYAASVFFGPHVDLGVFAQLAAPDVTAPNGTVYHGQSIVSPMFGASLDWSIAATPALSLEAQMGNLRVIPTSDGTLLLLGASLGLSYRP